MVSAYNTISTGIYVIRRRQLIELIEKAAQEGRYDFVQDILIRYKNLKRIYGYKMDNYWSNIAISRSLLSDKHGFPETGDQKLFLQTGYQRSSTQKLMICHRQNTIRAHR